MKPSRILATILVSALVVLMMTGVAFAATTNSFGRTYSGINNGTDFTGSGCTACHATSAASWVSGQAGPFIVDANPHSSMVTSIPGNLGSLIPTSGASGAWPAPSLGTGIRFNPANIQFEFGGMGAAGKDFVGIAGSALPAVSGVAAVPAVKPADDYPYLSGASWDMTHNLWAQASSATTVAPYFQGCGQCHNVGVTKPNNPTQGVKALPITGSVDPSATPTAWSALSIQCETCHGTGNVGNTTGTNHVGLGVGFTGYGAGPSITPNVILQAGVCGQCHVTGTAVAADGTYLKRYDSATTNMSAPLGFTANNVGNGLIPGQTSLLSFLDIKTIDTTGAVWPASGYAFYPNGSNKGMNHGYFNEYVSAVAQGTGGTSAPWDTTRTVNLTVVPGGRGHINSWLAAKGRGDATCMRCHSGDGRLAYIGRTLDPVNGKNIVSQSSYAATDYAGTDATATAIAGVTCQVCHTAHSSTENTASGGLGLRSGTECSDCHNWQFEVQGIAAANRPTVANIAAGTFAFSRVSHPTREVVDGTAMLDVPTGSEFMEGVECADCHMPATRAGTRSHSFLPMLPGDAKTWGVIANGGQDSCSPCHASLSLDTLQGKIDGWKADFTAANTAANTALSAARTRKGWATSITSTTSTDPEVVAYKIGAFNYSVAGAEGSGGIHNPPYEQAGLAVAKKYADAIGGNITGVGTSMIVTSGNSIGFFGVATNGSATPVSGGSIVVQSSPNGTTWTDVGTATTAANGSYSVPTGAITSTKLFRAEWVVRPAPGALVYTSSPFTVTVAAPGPVACRLSKSPMSAAFTLVRHHGSAVFDYSATLETNAAVGIPGKTILLQKSADGVNFTTVGGGTMVGDANGRVSVHLVFTGAGTSIWRWLFNGDTQYLPTSTSKTRITIH